MCFSFSSSTRKRFITIIIFCYIWSIFSPIIPPLAQACSLCPIQNSQFPPRPTCPICPTCRTRPTIHNSPPPLYFSIRLPSSSYLNVQPCHFFKRLPFPYSIPCLSSVLKRLPVLSLLRHCWLRSPEVAHKVVVITTSYTKILEDPYFIEMLY